MLPWTKFIPFGRPLGHALRTAAAAKSLQSCRTLCDPIDPPGSPVPGILQARTLEWVAISFSNAWKRKVKGKSLSPLRLSATPWTAAYKAPLPMGLSRQEYWSGLPLPSLSEQLRILNRQSSIWWCLWGVLDWINYSNNIRNWRRQWHPTPVFLPGESQGRGSLVGCRLWGRTESDTTEVT